MTYSGYHELSCRKCGCWGSRMEECEGCGRIFCGGCIGVEGHYCQYAEEVLTSYVERSYRPPIRHSKRTALSGYWKDAFKVGTVQSFTDNDIRYDILCGPTLQRLACTCYDFIQRRQVKTLDERHWHCKHIKKFLSDISPAKVNGVVRTIMLLEIQRENATVLQKQQALIDAQQRAKELKKEKREARRHGWI